MASCEKIKSKKRRVCLGDLDKRITLFTRNVTPSKDEDVDHVIKFDNPKKVWAMIKTTRGDMLFDGVNVTTGITHLIYIRFRDDSDFTDWVLYKGEYYDIDDIENLDERSEFLLLRCIKRGDKNKEASKS